MSKGLSGALGAVAAGVLLLGAAGCSSDDEGADDTSTEASGSASTEEETTTTEAADDDDTTTTEGDDVEPIEAEDVTWMLDAAAYRGQDGALVAYDCEAGGVADSVWGVDVYTDDSSVCTAAVHAGLITFEDGGRVVIRIAPGEESYEGSEANGVTTVEYGSWGGSFVFPES